MEASRQRVIGVGLTSEEGSTSLVGTNFDDLKGEGLTGSWCSLSGYHNCGLWFLAQRRLSSTVKGGLSHRNGRGSRRSCRISEAVSMVRRIKWQLFASRDADEKCATRFEGWLLLGGFFCG